MTDRYAGFVVTLCHDLREDDAAAVIAAIRQLRGVVGVEPVMGGFDVAIGTQRASTAWRRALLDTIKRIDRDGLDLGPD